MDELPEPMPVPEVDPPIEEDGVDEELLRERRLRVLVDELEPIVPVPEETPV